MTVTAVTPITGPYNGDASTVAFAYTFQITEEDDIVVTLTDALDVETVQTITSDYTVSGVGDAGGGTVTMVTAPAVGEKLTFSRAVALEQQTDLENRGAVSPEVLETAYDRLTLIAQDLQEQLGRAIQLPVSSGTSDIAFPTPNADKVIGWDTAGTALENKTVNNGAYINVPASVTDTSLVRWDGTDGQAFDEAPITISDLGAAAGFTSISMGGAMTGMTSLTMNGALSGATTVSMGGALTGATSVTMGGALTGATSISMGGALTNTATVPVFRLDDSDVSGTFDMQQNGATGTISVDPAGVDANSALQVQLDGVEAMVLDGESLDLAVNGSLKIPVGTTGQRPAAPAEGDIRRNSTTTQFEGYDGVSWGSLGGAGLFKGENGESGDSVNGAGDIFRVHEQELNTDTTIDADENSSAVGPLTVASGVTLTVTTGGYLVIV